MASGTKLGSQSFEKVLRASTYQIFIKCYKDEVSKIKPLSYSQIAMRAGFASKSFASDIAAGRKYVTISSLLPLIQGLGLKTDLAEYFKLLVYIQHPEICYPKKSATQLQSKLNNLRIRLLQSEAKLLSNADTAFGESYFPVIYAALGTVDVGATIEEIQLRTCLPKIIIEQTLQRLIHHQVIRKETDRYLACVNHMSQQTLTDESRFKDFYVQQVQAAAKEASENFSNKNKLFFASSFSISKSKLPELKEDLRQLLLDYVDSSEEAEGDDIAMLSCFFESLNS